MKSEHEIEVLVQAAQTDNRTADDLIARYMPFIRSETAKFRKTGMTDSV